MRPTSIAALTLCALISTPSGSAHAGPKPELPRGAAKPAPTRPAPIPTKKALPKAKTTAERTLDPVQTAKRALKVSGSANAKRVRKSAPVTRRHVLSQFDFEFLANDRQLDAVGVITGPNAIWTTFGDREYHRTVETSGFVFDNPYPDFFKRGSDAWRFDHRFIEIRGELETGEIRNARCNSGGTCRFPIPRRPDAIFVLRGFELDFAEGDRHIKYLSIMPYDGYVEVKYGDNSPDDPYGVSVQYAFVPREAQAHGDHARGGGHTKIQQGHGVTWDLDDDKYSNLAINGFEFMHPDKHSLAQAIGKTAPDGTKLDQDDTHVREFAVRTKADYNRGYTGMLRDDHFPPFRIQIHVARIKPEYVRSAPPQP